MNKNYYLQTLLDNYHLSCSTRYQQKHFNHLTFIYGYDTEADAVYIADFYDWGKYDFYTVSFEEICNSYSDPYFFSPQNTVTLMYLDMEDAPVNIKTDNIISSLNDYLNSEDSTGKYKSIYEWEGYNFYYGLACYDEIIKDLQAGHFITRTLQILYDHAVMMEYKVDTLYKERIIIFDSKYEKLKNDIIKIKNSARNTINLFLKYYFLDDDLSLTKKEKALNNVISKLVDLKEMSRIFTRSFIDILSANSLIDYSINEEYNSKISDDVLNWNSDKKISYTSHLNVTYPTKRNSVDLGQKFTETVNIEYDLIPFRYAVFAEVGFAPKDALINSYEDIPIIVRICERTKYFEVFNGDKYMNDKIFMFEPNKTYHVRLIVDLADKNYSVYVNEENEKEILIADKYKFRFTASTPDNIGSYRFIKQDVAPGYYTGYLCMIKNLSVNNNIIQNTADTAIKIENNSAVRILDAAADNLSVELSVKLKDITESILICPISDDEVSAEFNLNKDYFQNSKNDDFDIVRLNIENGVCNLYINETVIYQNIAFKNTNYITALKISTDGTVFIKKLSVKK